MATIELYAKKINQMPRLIQEAKKSVTDYKAELSRLQTKSLSINRSVCNLDSVISSIQSSTQTQEQTIASLDAFYQNSENFIADVVRIDGNVADVINERKDNFYDEYSYLKPKCEKNGWEKFCDGCKAVGQWCKEHWKIIVTVVLVVVAIAIIVCTAGTTLGPMATILVGVAKGLIMGAITGGIMGGLSSVVAGGSFFDGFENGAFTGALAGALFGGLGGVGQVLGSSCKVLKFLGTAAKAIPIISKISAGISLGMAGFDLLSFGVGLFDPTNPLVQFNQMLHSNKLYNAFQIGISALAVFSGGFTKGMQNPVCFIAGTMILTGSGLVEIENIKAGNKVLSTNVETLKRGEKTVLQTFVNESKELVHVTVNGEKISTTPGHMFYDVNKGWISAASLSRGSVLMLSDTSRTEVECVTFETFETPVKVYNFEVEDWHTYHVGNSGVLVHNDCKPEAAVLGSKKHGVNWKEGAARAKATNKPQGQWSKSDIDYATKMANTLGVGESAYFELPKGSTSIVHMPDGTIVKAIRFWIKNNGVTWHGYPMQ